MLHLVLVLVTTVTASIKRQAPVPPSFSVPGVHIPQYVPATNTHHGVAYSTGQQTQNGHAYSTGQQPIPAHYPIAAAPAAVNYPIHGAFPLSYGQPAQAYPAGSYGVGPQTPNGASGANSHGAGHYRNITFSNSTQYPDPATDEICFNAKCKKWWLVPAMCWIMSFAIILIIFIVILVFQIILNVRRNIATD